ncbi:MAG: hypothetical protein AB1899_16975 [Pseudomonadota bacterium]
MKNALLLAALFGLALALPAQATEDEDWARALEIPCHPLVTEAECRVHQDLLASLPEGAQRDTYLASYLAMVEDRMRSCGCSLAQNGVGKLRYR